MKKWLGDTALSMAVFTILWGAVWIFAWATGWDANHVAPWLALGACSAALTRPRR